MRIKNLLWLIPALCLALSCEKLERESNLTPDELAPLVPIDLTKADRQVRDASNDFGLSIFRHLYSHSDGTVAFSPLSLSLAMAMAAEGAEGETYQQFSDVIGWNASTKEEVGSYYRKMIEGLAKVDTQVHLNSANSLWAAGDLTLKDGYKSLLEQYFDAEGYTVDFSLPATMDRINQWCSDKTEGKIPQMLTDLDPATKLMLINALLFKAPWSHSWDIKKNRVFTTAGGAKVKKDYLFVKDQLMDYGDFGDCELVRARYGNGAYRMDIILPKEGKTLADILPILESDDINHELARSEVTLYLPKWATDYSTGDNLIPAMQAQGLTLPFTPAADFSGISDKPLLVNMVEQKVRIDVTEKGTEFAAVTVVGMFTSGIGKPVTPPKVTVDVNRPFIYTIREATSGTILLLGTLSN